MSDLIGQMRQADQVLAARLKNSLLALGAECLEGLTINLARGCENEGFPLFRVFECRS